jgi:formylglycine-generating enzyme required for sulfatase activity
MLAFKPYRTVGLLLACVLTYTVSAAEKSPEAAFTNSIGMKFVCIEPGTFTMGFDEKEFGDALKPEHIPRKYLKSGNYDESPRHKVTITKPFYISETEVTIEQFKQFRPDFPGFKARLDYDPYVSGISWYDAVAFCKWLSEKENRPYRLPTEAEWEYVCRAGTQTPFSSGYSPPTPETPNPWGIKNMHTGVLEWCYDWHGLYREEPQTDPVGPKQGWMKVVRGGGLDILDKQTMSFYFGREVNSWALGKNPFYVRSANRAAVPPNFAPPPREYQAKQMEGINPPLPPGPQSPSPYRAKGLVGGWHNIGFRPRPSKGRGSGPNAAGKTVRTRTAVLPKMRQAKRHRNLERP